MINVQTETCRYAKILSFFVLSKILFTFHRLLNFNTQRNIHNCTIVHICIIYRAVDVLTSAINGFYKDDRHVIYLTPTICKFKYYNLELPGKNTKFCNFTFRVANLQPFSSSFSLIRFAWDLIFSDYRGLSGMDLLKMKF